MSKYIQEVVVDGNDLLVSVRGVDDTKPLGLRRWKGAARYVYATKEFKGKGVVMVLAVPVQAGIDLTETEEAGL